MKSFDAVGLEEHMLEEPAWPELQNARIYPDQPQGISRDDGEWVLGHKEFRYAIVPENAGEMVLPEVRLDWWDTVNHRQRTAILPEHKVTVLPSDLAPAVAVLPAVPDGMIAPGIDAAGGPAGPYGGALLWKTTTGVFALLWLLTLYFFYRRGSVVTTQTNSNGSVSVDEKALLKQLQQACQKGNAPVARKDLAQWIRNYAPHSMRGSMRDFGASCGDQALAQGIAELDSSGFADEGSVDWNGSALWLAFRAWQKRTAKPAKTDVGESPDLYTA